MTENKDLDAFEHPEKLNETIDAVDKVKNPFDAAKEYVEYLDSLPRGPRRKHFKLRFSDIVRKKAGLM